MNIYSKKFNVELSFVEIGYLLSLAKDNKNAGDYWGNYKQFHDRQDRIIDKLQQVFNEALECKND